MYLSYVYCQWSKVHSSTLLWVVSYNSIQWTEVYLPSRHRHLRLGLGMSVRRSRHELKNSGRNGRGKFMFCSIQPCDFRVMKNKKHIHPYPWWVNSYGIIFWANTTTWFCHTRWSHAVAGVARSLHQWNLTKLSCFIERGGHVYVHVIIYTLW